MIKHKKILISVVCYSMAVLGDQRPPHMPPTFPIRKPGVTKEEFHNEVEEFLEQKRRQKREINKEHMNFLVRQAWPRLLRIPERQWIRIKPKSEKVRDLLFQSHVGAGSGVRNLESFHWNRPSESHYHPMEDMARDQMPEGYRIVEELIDLLEDEKSRDEQIRNKINELQQARKKAREALPQAKKELAVVLTTPHQEAIFLILGQID